MSAASNRISQDEAHESASASNVAGTADQHQPERSDNEEDEHAAQGSATKHAHTSAQTVTASTSQQQHSQDSHRPDFAPDLAAWDTRTSYAAPASNETLLPPADFRPFFALIEDPATGEYHHPNVHYIFSDDEDQGAITSEALAVLDREDHTAHQDEVEERVLLLDMEADGRTVASVASLSADWQAIQTEITKAPSWGDSKQGADRGLMLKIAGKEVHTRDTARDVDIRDLEGLVAQFGRQLESLDEVVGKEDTRVQSEVPSAAQSQRAGSRAE